MIGLDNEIPLGYDDYEGMSQLPIATERDEKDVDDELAFALASHGVVREHSSALMSADRRSQARSDECSLVSDAIRTSQPTTDEELPTPSSSPEKPKRKRSRRRTLSNIAVGVTTALLAGWFAWCGIAAWHTDSQASSLKSQASSVVYETVDIETLKPGDTVIAMNPETGEVALKRVLNTFQRTTDHVYNLLFEMATGDIQIIEATNEHPFWIENERQWKKAKDLVAGDQVKGPTSEIQTLVFSEYEAHPEGVNVYNFEVEDRHTYFVLAQSADAPPILVHNTCTPKATKWNKRDKPWKQIIDGRAQGTKTDGHRFRSYREAIKMAKSGDYVRVRLNRSYSTTTGVRTTPRRLPDVIGVRKNGRVDAIEVPSATDSFKNLTTRNFEAMNQLPEEWQGMFRIREITPTPGL